MEEWQKKVFNDGNKLELKLAFGNIFFGEEVSKFISRLIL